MTSPSTTGSDIGSGILRRFLRAILRVLADEAVALFWWGLLIAGALIGFWRSAGTSYFHLAAGALISSVSLFVLMVVFECVWRTINR